MSDGFPIDDSPINRWEIATSGKEQDQAACAFIDAKIARVLSKRKSKTLEEAQDKRIETEKVYRILSESKKTYQESCGVFRRIVHFVLAKLGFFTKYSSIKKINQYINTIEGLYSPSQALKRIERDWKHLKDLKGKNVRFYQKIIAEFHSRFIPSSKIQEAFNLAVKMEDIKLMTKLLERKDAGKIASFDIKDKDGNTALILSVKNKENASVRLLLEKGANIHFSNKFGQTALSLAVEQENILLVKKLLAKGADPESLKSKNPQINELLQEAKKLYTPLKVFFKEFPEKAPAKSTIEKRFRELSLHGEYRHPDKGGNTEKNQELVGFRDLLLEKYSR